MRGVTIVPPAAVLAALKQVDFTIPRSFINRIKEEFRSHHAASGGPCTSIEVVTAAIWQCRTRAINAAPAVSAPLMFTANVRKFIGPKDGYYGNCVFSQSVQATSGVVANGTMVDVVGLIEDAKARIPDALNAGVVDVDGELMASLCGYNMLGVSSWGGIGLDDIDFGGGRPARVLPNLERTRLPSCFPCLPCSKMDDPGANVTAYCVPKEHVDEFHAELARLR